jgi:hypothetical protein
MEQEYRYLNANKDQHYKSWGEEQLARLFEREDISYDYEQPMAVVDKGKLKIWYPDFWLRDYGFVVEYFGINGKQNYDEQARHKMKVYKQTGIEGLFLTEACFKGDWPGSIMGQIESLLKGRLDRFYNREQQKKYK